MLFYQPKSVFTALTTMLLSASALMAGNAAAQEYRFPPPDAVKSINTIPTAKTKSMKSRVPVQRARVAQPTPYGPPPGFIPGRYPAQAPAPMMPQNYRPGMLPPNVPARTPYAAPMPRAPYTATAPMPRAPYTATAPMPRAPYTATAPRPMAPQAPIQTQAPRAPYTKGTAPAPMTSPTASAPSGSGGPSTPAPYYGPPRGPGGPMAGPGRPGPGGPYGRPGPGGSSGPFSGFDNIGFGPFSRGGGAPWEKWPFGGRDSFWSRGDMPFDTTRNPTDWVDPEDPKEGLAIMWDDLIAAPDDLGTMPGGWYVPSISVPNPVDLEDQMEEASKEVPDLIRIYH